MTTSTWTPGKIDLEWADSVLKLTNDGAIWAYPGAEQIWRISHTNKTVTLQIGPFTPWHEDQIEKTRLTFAHYGYTVVDDRKTPNPN